MVLPARGPVHRGFAGLSRSTTFPVGRLPVCTMVVWTTLLHLTLPLGLFFFVLVVDGWNLPFPSTD